MAQIKVNQSIFARVVRMMMDGPVTTRDITEETGLHIVTAQALMRDMKRHKVVHIAGWDPDVMGRPLNAAYRLGEGKDALRPSKTAAELSKGYRVRLAQRKRDAVMRRVVDQAPDR